MQNERPPHIHARAWARGAAPAQAEIDRVHAAIGWNRVDLSPARLTFRRPGMALTLNGIAQGYIADKVAALLRGEGVENVLVNTGEIAAFGRAPEGGPWRIGLPDRSGARLPLTEGAVATSAPSATTFDSARTAGHLIDPRTGRPGGLWSRVTVMSKSAAEADALSTAFCLMAQPQIEAVRRDSYVVLGDDLNRKAVSGRG